MACFEVMSFNDFLKRASGNWNTVERIIEYLTKVKPLDAFDGAVLKTELAINSLLYSIRKEPLEERKEVLERVVSNWWYFNSKWSTIRNAQPIHISERKKVKSYLKNGFIDYGADYLLFLLDKTPILPLWMEYYPFKAVLTYPQQLTVIVPNKIFLEYYKLFEYNKNHPYKIVLKEELTGQKYYEHGNFYEDTKMYRIINEGCDPPDNRYRAYTFKNKSRSISKGLRFNVLKRDGYRCVICGRNSKEDGVKLEIDHIHPVSKGGGKHIENLQTLCGDCNRGKSDKSM